MRRCIYRYAYMSDDKKEGVFHGFYQFGEQPMAIVENEKGECIAAPFDCIVFKDVPPDD